MTDDKNPAPSISEKTINCPKAKANHYFVKACETIIKPGNYRSWCKQCHHFLPKQEVQKEENIISDLEETC